MAEITHDVTVATPVNPMWLMTVEQARELDKILEDLGFTAPINQAKLQGVQFAGQRPAPKGNYHYWPGSGKFQATGSAIDPVQKYADENELVRAN